MSEVYCRGGWEVMGLNSKKNTYIFMICVTEGTVRPFNALSLYYYPGNEPGPLR